MADRWPCGCPVTAADRTAWRAARSLRIAAEVLAAATRSFELVAARDWSGFHRFIGAHRLTVEVLQMQPPPWVVRVVRRG